MLRVAALRDRTGRYYLADLGSEVALAAPGGGQGSGRWFGDAAPGLGLRGAVDAEALERLLHGCHPQRGVPLRQRSTGVSAYDLTFAAPKSVSVLWALGTARAAEVVLSAHEEAVGAALGYVSAHAVAVRRGTGTDRRLDPARAIVGARFSHGTSRALDPHLHTHALVVNLAHGQDGRWTAVDGRGLFAHARAAGALYDAHLRHRISERLGLTWGARRSGAYELDVVDPALLGALSSRQAEILGHLEERASHSTGGGAPRPSRAARTVAWAATRAPKGEVPSLPELRSRCRAAAADAGWTSRAFIQQIELAGNVAPGARREAPAVGRLDEHRFMATLGVTAHGGVARRDVVAAWAGAVAPGTTANEVGRCVDTLAPWDADVGVEEKLVAYRAVSVPAHVVSALGARPAAYDLLLDWQQAARAIERYRSRWALDDAREPLGVSPAAAALSRVPALRLAEHTNVARLVAQARARLGLERAHDVSSVERSIGW